MIIANFDLEQQLWNEGYQYIAGLDEVGRGPLAGPVCVGIVVFPRNIITEIEYRDSKLLSARKREELAPLIKSQTKWAIGQASNSEIDQLGIMKAQYKAVERALNQIGLIPDILLTDALPLPTIKDIKVRPVSNGDSLVATIAAASIIAKVYRDQLMTEQDANYPSYGFARHKGYGTLEHRMALEKYGPCSIHRHTFLH
jgi:ribonuclease HII